MEALNFILPFVGSLIGAFGAIIAATFWIARHWGATEQETKDHAQRLNLTNGKLQKQEEKDEKIMSEIACIKSTCDARKELLQAYEIKNQQEHDEINKNIRYIENKFSAQIDKKFSEWRTYIQQDIKAAIYEHMK